MSEDLSSMKDEYKEKRQLELPRLGRRKRKHELGMCHVLKVTRGKRLKKSKKKVIDSWRGIKEDKPDLVTTGQRMRVAEVSSRAFGHSPTKFFNPAWGIAHAIRDSMDPEKVLRDTPRPVKRLGDMDDAEIAEIEAKYGKVSDRSGPSREVQINVVGVLEEREKAKCYLLPSGWPLWLPKSCIISEGKGCIRVPFYVKFKKVFRLPPKPKAEVRRMLLESRIKRRTKE